MSQSRIYNSIRNMKFAFINQIISLLMSFISRKIFVLYLTQEYLGLNGLFSNILSILSLAELGIGSAITFSMYKPLAENDEKTLKALLNIYKKAYRIIGIFIIVIGFSLTPFLKFFIKDMPNISNIQYIYMLYVLSSAVTYFFGFKQTIISADQKQYIITKYNYIFNVLTKSVQMIILIFTRNYMLYLIYQILLSFIQNIMLYIKADNIYPFIKGHNDERLDIENKNIIIRNIKAMFIHKIGSTVVYCTDNLLISKFVGIVMVGLYSNYTLIIGVLTSVYNIIFNSVTASIGNLCAISDNENEYNYFKIFNLIYFWIYGFSSICLYFLFNPFISIWLGKDYILGQSIVTIIVINFYIVGMRGPALSFKNAIGLFWNDRYKAILESILNLVVSIYLGRRIGIFGILIGTTISMSLTCTWIEPYVVFKYGFKISCKSYFIDYFKNILLCIFSGLVVGVLINILNFSGLFGFIVKMFICAVIPNIIFLLFLKRKQEFNVAFNILMKRILKRG